MKIKGFMVVSFLSIVFLLVIVCEHLPLDIINPGEEFYAISYSEYKIINE